MENAIELNGVSKIYKLYNNKKERLKETFSLTKKKYHQDFYALKNINLKIKKGGIIGFLGKNGAGKSTLLKIITGVLTPTFGEVKVNGKISALIELGAGFNREYTGMENIYHYGVLMGYSKEEMKKKVKEITDFADIGNFIYQPVKNYSSGMFARLAFSVAINIEPEILIVDEILSVGDFVFQHKCFQKFKELMKKGITILYVTHNTQDVLKYCKEAVLLKNGEIIYQSNDVKSVVFEYEKTFRKIDRGEKSEENFIESPFVIEQIDNLSTEVNKKVNEKRMGTHEAIIKSLRISDEKKENNRNNVFISGEKIKFEFEILSKREFKSVILGFSIKTITDDVIWGDNTLKDYPELKLKKGKNIIEVEFELNIVSGDYFIYAGLADISGERVELDQRWPIDKISIVSLRSMAEGKVYAPTEIEIY